MQTEFIFSFLLMKNVFISVEYQYKAGTITQNISNASLIYNEIIIDYASNNLGKGA